MITVLTGENDYAIRIKLSSIIAEFRSSNGDSIERFSGFETLDFGDVVNAIRSISLFDNKKLVIISDFSKSKNILDNIEGINSQIADSTKLILVDSKLDKRTSAYKFLKINANLIVFNNLDLVSLQNWVLAKFKEQGSTISPASAAYLIERVGQNQQQLDKEVEKLCLSGQSITNELIDRMAEQTPKGKIFDLLEVLFLGKLEKAWGLYKGQRAQGEAPQKIIAMIVWQLQQFTLAIYANPKTTNTLVKSGMSSYTAQKSLQAVSNISKADLRFYISRLSEIDAQSKTSADVESALEVYFSEITDRLAIS